MAYFSTNSSDYSNAINSLVKPTYESKYENTINSIMDKITNREAFSYDFNADPLYQNYKDQYTKLGNEASMNAVANTSAMTGGFANSYSATAASQANQQYLTQLNSVIPELYNAALQKYEMETEDLYNQFGMYETEENRLYGQNRDNVSDYYNDLSDLRGGYSTALGGEQWQKDYDLSVDEFETSKQQWQKDYELSLASYELNKAAYESGLSQWQSTFDNSNAQWEKEFAENQRQFNESNKLSWYNATKSGGGVSGTTEDSNVKNGGLATSENIEKYKSYIKQAANSGYSYSYIDTRYIQNLIDSGRINMTDAETLLKFADSVAKQKDWEK